LLVDLVETANLHFPGFVPRFFVFTTTAPDDPQTALLPLGVNLSVLTLHFPRPIFFTLIFAMSAAVQPSPAWFAQTFTLKVH
jgi:hypothetical protein